jgi:DNA invertase Pin-like site-specific DNA recombinase
MKPVKRCALYTRKSSDEGLDQAFNSLDAQREACQAYVKSQKGEGWRALATIYDDGGYSGGTMERPALQRLLADIEADRVDVVVVYKIDRLTRSLTDFARMVDLFDRHGATFVSVTQAFNTTTSMGRLTLNVLLSFAQFEREVTGERIRDKIAASKSKGMWMGGNVPLGYDLPTEGSRALVVNEAEAAAVRTIFSTYLELGSVHALQRWLDARGIRSKRRRTRAGRTIGGRAFSRGALFQLLRNRIYLGQIVHKDKVHDGLHPAIVDVALFERRGRRHVGANGGRCHHPAPRRPVPDHRGGDRGLGGRDADRARHRPASASLDGAVARVDVPVGEPGQPGTGHGLHRRRPARHGRESPQHPG